MHNYKKIILFGGSGFIGRYIVNILAENGYLVKIFTRKANKSSFLKMCGNFGQVEIIEGSISDKDLVSNSIIGCDVVINLLGILYESKKDEFEYVHVELAKFLAQTSHENNVKFFIHFSAMGVENNEYSLYARSKVLGEKSVRAAFPEAIIIKPGLVFGCEDNFFNKFAKLAVRFPFLLLVGKGTTEFQPVYVNDIAKVIDRILKGNVIKKTYVIGGPKIYSLKYLIQFILSHSKRCCYLMNISFPLANLLASIFELKILRFLLKPFTGSTDPLLTRDQVKLLRYSQITKSNDLEELGIIPISIEEIVPQYLKIYKKFSNESVQE